ncbi:MAG: hypothetical protein ABI204_04725 [Ginsengibacter sp.]
MIKSDQLVIVGIIAILFIQTTVWIVGYSIHKLSYLFSFVNSTAAIILIGYWIINQLRIQQHCIECREIIVLCAELLVAVISIFTIVSHPVSTGYKIVQYIIFGIHFTVLVAALIFMLTFKINKLF